MKLLIITQKIDINDDVLGFFHHWVEKLAEKAEGIYVIANFVGEYSLPTNVKVFSLGKEKDYSKIRRYFIFYKELFKILLKTDGVFFHMCPEYVIATGLLPKVLRKKTLFWYVHKSMNWKLRLAEKLIDKIFTASKESFRLPSKKVEITGHGIDIDKFKSQNSKFKITSRSSKFAIITAGRISKIKNINILIEAAGILKDKFQRDFEILIAGKPITKEDEIYFQELKKSIEKQGLNDIIRFIGPLPYSRIPEFYQKADLFINLSDTGSVDKAILEAMASGLPILTCNEAIKDILNKEYQDLLMFRKEDLNQLVNKFFYFYKINEETRRKIGEDLRQIVINEHNLTALVEKIMNFMQIN